MDIEVCLIFNYKGKVEQKWVDPDIYGYLDLISDIYKGVLGHIPDKRSATFNVRYKNPDIEEEIDVTSDSILLNLLHTHGSNEILLDIEDLQVDSNESSGHTINVLSNEVVGRPTIGEKLSMPGRRQVPAAIRKNDIPASSRPMKAAIRRGGGTMGRTISSCTLKSQGGGKASSKSTANVGGFKERRAICKSEVTSKGKSVAKVTSKFCAVAEGSEEGSSEDDMDDGSDESSSDHAWSDFEEDGIEEDSQSENEGEGFTAESPIHSDRGEKMDKDDSCDVLSDYSDGGNADQNEVRFEGYDIGSEEKVGLKVGLVFQNANAFRAVLKEFQIQECFEVYYMKNESRRISAICKAEGCEWRVNASSVDAVGTIMIKTYTPTHTCNMRVYKNSNANSVWIAQKLGKLIRADPDLKIDAMYSLLNAKYDIQPNKSQLWRAKKLALETNFGKHEMAYRQLPRYGHILLEHNPGSTFKFQFESDINRVPRLNPQFKRLFVCLQASKNGFLKGCRPFIGLDGCHLKGPYGGVLLAAISLDGNNGLFPLAFGVVEVECKDSWAFFLEQLNAAINLDGTPLTLMSDKQKGLTDAISNVFPNAQQRWCSRHLYANFKVKFTGLVLKTYFWAACKAPNEFQFKKAMGAMKEVNQGAHDWLMRFPLSVWSRHAFDHRCRSEHITNNTTESFNHWIKDLRGKTILTLIDGIRQNLMVRMHNRYVKGCSFEGKVTPTVKRRLNLISKDSRYCRPLAAGANLYEVQDGVSKLVVDLSTKSCNCGLWQATGLPCKHAASVIFHNRGQLENFCDEYFTVQRFLQAYGELIHPVPDIPMDMSDGSDGIPVLDPPEHKIQPGRPKKNRKRDPEEGPPPDFRRRMSTVTCDNCKQTGHNKRTCRKAPVVEHIAKRKHGQPNQKEVSTSQRSTRSQSQNARSSGGSLQARKRAKMDAMIAKRHATAKEASGMTQKKP